MSVLAEEIAAKALTIAERQQEVYNAGYAKGQAAGGNTESAYNEGYEAGQQAEYIRQWDEITWNGERKNYSHAFKYMPFVEFKPPVKIVPEECNCMFEHAEKLKTVSAEYIDFSQAKAGNNNYVNYANFSACFELEDLSEIVFPPGGYAYTFNTCRKLHSIGGCHFNENDPITSTAFYACYELVNLPIYGTIGQNGFSVTHCTKLSHDSLMSIINALKDYSEDTSGTVWKVTLGSTNIKKLTDAEKAIATEKGWTLA